MTWNSYYDSYLGQEPIVREHRRGEGPVRGPRGDQPLSPRVPPRDPRGDQPLSPRVPPRDPRPPRPVEDPRVTMPPFPQPQPDPRVTTPPFPQPQPDPRVTTPPFPQPQPDPRVTTRPEDLFPRDDRDRDRDRRRHHRHRRHREQYDPPWGHRYYGDYMFLAGYGWLPRWYPYWDPRWYDYWWFLFDYYGGDVYADYAAYARDAFLRQQARRYGWL